MPLPPPAVYAQRVKRLVLLLVLALLAFPSVSLAGTLSGTLAERHDDAVERSASTGGRSAGRESEVSYVLDRQQGTVELDPGQEEELVGQRVRVQDASAAPGVQGRATATDSTRVGAPAGPRARKLAVVMINFTDNRSTPVTADQVRARVWTATDSANQYYQRQSDGAASLVGRDRVDGDVYGWFELPIASTGCDVNQFSARARAAAAARGVDLSGYDHVQFFFPTVPDCKFGGLGDLPGSETWINGYLQTGLVAHELGHNFGVHHAGSISCTDASGAKVAVGTNCAFSEYGDPFDAMGKGSKLMSSWHRAQLSQLPPAERRTVTASGTYELGDANDFTAGGPKLILIPRKRAGQLTTDFYSLEIRRPLLPFDDWTAAQPEATGVSIRLVPGVTQLLESRLVDNVPSTPEVTDAPLQPGGTFTDPDYGIRITNSGADGAATLDVTVPVLPDTTPPTPATDLAAALDGNAVDVSWGASDDDEAFGQYEITRNSSVIATTRETSFRDTATAGLDTATYRVVAVDRAGNRAAGDAVTVRLPDTVPPAAPGSPRATQTASGVAVSWTAAADNRGVSRYEVLRDGALVAGPSGTSVEDVVAPGVFAYTVRAIDTAGNVGPASVPVTIDTRSDPAPPPSAPATSTTPPGAPAFPAPPAPPPPAGHGPTRVPSTVPRAPAARRVRLVAPRPAKNTARVPRSGRLTFQATGARALSIRIGGRTVRVTRGARATYVLPRRYRRAGRVVLRVTASGGRLKRAETVTFVVRGGRITVLRR